MTISGRPVDVVRRLVIVMTAIVLLMMMMLRMLLRRMLMLQVVRTGLLLLFGAVRVLTMIVELAIQTGLPLTQRELLSPIVERRLVLELAHRDSGCRHVHRHLRQLVMLVVRGGAVRRDLRLSVLQELAGCVLACR